MTKFLKKLGLYGLLVIAVMVSAALLFTLFYNTPSPKKKYVLLGDSTGKATVDNRIATDYENYSQGGEAYLYTYEKLRKLAETKKIDTVLINFSTINIFKPENSGITAEGRSRYLPMLGKEEQFILMKSNPYNYAENWALIGYDAIQLVKNDTISFGGYTANPGSYKKFEYDPKTANTIPTYQKIYLDKIVKFCKDKNLHLIFLELPKYSADPKYRYYRKPEFIEFYSKNYPQTDFLSFAEMDLGGKESFRDMVHTNDIGAQKFSEFLNKHSLKELLNSKYNLKNDHR